MAETEYRFENGERPAHLKPVITTQNTEMSPELNEIFSALSKLQGDMENAKKSSANPFFKSKFADLAEVWDTIRPHLAKYGLCVPQLLSDGPDGTVVVTTICGHQSGQWIKSTFGMRPAKNDPQGRGSAASYGRRYALSAMLGVAQADDDGNAASGKAEAPKKPAPKKMDHITLDEAKELNAMAKDLGFDEKGFKDYLKQTWKAQSLNAVKKKDLEEIKKDMSQIRVTGNKADVPF